MIAPVFLYLMVAASVLSFPRPSPGDSPSRRIEAIPTMSSRMLDLRAGYTPSKERLPNAASIQDDSESCAMLYNKAYSYSNNHMWQMCFDTAKKLVETCPNYIWTASVFDMMTSSLYQLGDTPDERAAYLKWLESVLYLNSSDEWFCSVLMAMSGTLPIPYDTAAGHGSRATNIGLSLWHWMLLNADCDTPYLWQDYQASRKSQWQDWYSDRFAYNLDTTLPPLSTWGLDTLFAKRSLYVSAPALQATLLLSAVASPNPANDGTLLTFGLAKQTYVKIDLLDVLGHEIAQPHFESLFEQGNHAIPLSLHDLPSGTYYARLVTSYGEARTVKIVKE